MAFMVGGLGGLIYSGGWERRRSTTSKSRAPSCSSANAKGKSR